MKMFPWLNSTWGRHLYQKKNHVIIDNGRNLDVIIAIDKLTERHRKETETL